MARPWEHIPRYPEGHPFGGRWMKLIEVDPGLLKGHSVSSLPTATNYDSPPNVLFRVVPIIFGVTVYLVLSESV